MGAHRAMGVRSGAPFPAAVHSFDLPHLHDPAAVRRMPGSAPTNESERIGAAHRCGLSRLALRCGRVPPSTSSPADLNVFLRPAA